MLLNTGKHTHENEIFGVIWGLGHFRVQVHEAYIGFITTKGIIPIFNQKYR